MSALPDAAYLGALASLSRVGPARLAALVADRCPAQVWAAIVGGRLQMDERLAGALGRDAGTLPARWSAEARGIDPREWLAAHERCGIQLLTRADPGFPAVFDGDPTPPELLLAVGDLAALAAPRVAIVGTRRCTRYGYDLARAWGAELASAGIAVVSGLAAGIDAAAHLGALEGDGAPPVGVVGSGLDVPYPAANRALWQDVSAAGLLLSEYGLGAAPVAWHFPARNRIIAALAHVVVVVESLERGGAMSTAGEAFERDRPVLAVPGSVHSSTAAGPHLLLTEGAHVARDVADILGMLQLLGVAEITTTKLDVADVRVAPDADGASVLEVLGWSPATVEQLLVRSGLALGSLSLALERLVASGHVSVAGGWYQQLAPSRAANEAGVSR